MRRSSVLGMRKQTDQEVELGDTDEKGHDGRIVNSLAKRLNSIPVLLFLVCCVACGIFVRYQGNIQYSSLHSSNSVNQLQDYDAPLYQVPDSERNPSKQLRNKVAIIISITDESERRYHDLPAALAQSVYEMQNSSKYDFELIALMQPHFRSSMGALKGWGFRVLRRTLPVKLSELPLGRYKAKVDKSGCCGLAELLKLHSYTFTEFHRVVHLDADVMITGNIDHLLDKPDHISLQYTNSTLKGERLSGGVLIIKPSLTVFEEIVAIIREGDYRYDGSGWRGSGIGFAWGGETIQGVLAYYYEGLLPRNASERLDRCIYNNQGSDECRNTPVEKIKMMHMTLCQKPFMCMVIKQKPICAVQQDYWWMYTHRLLDRLGLERNPRCDRFSRVKSIPRKYVPIDFSRKPSAQSV